MKLGINRINIWMLLLCIIKNTICPFMKSVSLKREDGIKDIVNIFLSSENAEFLGVIHKRQ